MSGSVSLCFRAAIAVRRLHKTHTAGLDLSVHFSFKR